MVAMLSTNAAVLHVLKRRIGKRNVKKGVTRSVEVISKSVSDGASSSSSVNNDWKNWVVLHGNEDVKVEDVRGMGKAIGVNFKGDSHNKFSVLSKVGKEKRKSKIKKRGGGKTEDDRGSLGVRLVGVRVVRVLGGWVVWIRDGRLDCWWGRRYHLLCAFRKLNYNIVMILFALPCGELHLTLFLFTRWLGPLEVS